MLRECQRVLKRGGRIAGYVIHTSRDLTPTQVARASEFGPGEVGASGAPEELLHDAGFGVLVVRDVTENFRATCAALLQARRGLARELRAEEGDEVFEDELRAKEAMLEGIDEGLLQRSLIVGLAS